MAPHKLGKPEKTRLAWANAFDAVSSAVGNFSDRTDELKVEFGVNLTKIPEWAEVETHLEALKAATDALGAGLAYSITPEPFDESHAAYKEAKRRRRLK